MQVTIVDRTSWATLVLAANVSTLRMDTCPFPCRVKFPAKAKPRPSPMPPKPTPPTNARMGRLNPHTHTHMSCRNSRGSTRHCKHTNSMSQPGAWAFTAHAARQGFFPDPTSVSNPGARYDPSPTAAKRQEQMQTLATMHLPSCCVSRQ